jgi:diacylglycerol kinase family enzyme
MESEPHLPVLTEVDDLNAENGVLTWTAGESQGELKIAEIVLIFRQTNPANGSRYIISGLIQNADDKEHPFVSKFLATTSIPADLQQYVVDKIPAYLHHDGQNQVDVIVSTKSGLGNTSNFWENVLQPLWTLFAATGIAEGSGKATAVPPRVLVTQHAHSVRMFAQDLWSEQQQESDAAKARTVVLLSGDGGVVDLLNGCKEFQSAAPQVSIALLPLGTGNALFHSTHKPLYVEAGPSPLVVGLRSLFNGRSTDLPVFRASFSEGSRIVTFADKDKKEEATEGEELHLSRQETVVSHLYGGIVASYGFHASIVYESDTPGYRVYGDKRFGMVAQELLRESHPYAATVSYSKQGAPEDLQAIERDTHAYVLTTLVSNLERTFTISPDGKPLDGQLRLVHFGPVGGERTLDVMMKAYDGGKHVGLKWDDGEGVGYENVEEVKIVAKEEDSRWRNVCIDGTIVELPHKGQVTIKKLEKSPCRIVVNHSILIQ